MQSYNLWTQRITARGRTAAAALLSAAALMACDVEQADPSAQGAAEIKPVQSQTLPTGNLQTKEAESGPERNGVDPSSREGNKSASRPATVDFAVAMIHAAEGLDVKGDIEFKPAPGANSMLVTVRLEGLKAGAHGIHIHEGGDCWKGGEFVAGNHFNPNASEHGGPDSSEHHVGDMGNITADSDGRVDTVLTLSGLSLAGAESILRRAVVIHGGKDDLSSQPSGDAGPPVACGIVLQER